MPRRKQGELVPTNGPAALALAHELGARPYATGLVIEQADLSYEHWENIGRSLAFVGNAWQWWVGDWFNIGEELFGDDASNAVDDLQTRYDAMRRITGSATGTLQNVRAICKKVPQPTRRDELGFWVHAEVAPLHEDPAAQKEWLDRAVKQRWNRGELREALRAVKKTRKQSDPDPEPGEDPHAGVDADQLERAARLVWAQTSFQGGQAATPMEAMKQLGAALGYES